MTPIIIFVFLVGAVLAMSFRVWILIPVAVLTMIGVTIFELFSSASLLGALRSALLVCFMPQLGYVFGLFVRYGMKFGRQRRVPKGAATDAHAGIAIAPRRDRANQH